MKKLIFILPALCLFACSKDDIVEKQKEEETTTPVDRPVSDSKTEAVSVNFLIPEGERLSTPNPVVQTTSSELSFGVIFDSTCIYKQGQSNSGNDFNILYGFSEGGNNPLENSAAIAWQWKEGAIHLFAVVTRNGETSNGEIGQVSIGRVVACRITCQDRAFQFEVNNSVFSIPSGQPVFKSRQILNPYFGEANAAPHDIHIEIFEKKK